MRTLLSERFAPITSSIGFLEVPLDDAARALEAWRRSLYPSVTVSRPPDGFADVLQRLEPLTGGARPRELLVGAGGWTAYFDNSLHGTDAVSAVGHLSRTLRCQGLAIDVVPHTVRAGPEAVFVASDVPMAPDSLGMSLRETQEWFGIVPGMADTMPG